MGIKTRNCHEKNSKHPLLSLSSAEVGMVPSGAKGPLVMGCEIWKIGKLGSVDHPGSSWIIHGKLFHVVGNRQESDSEN